MPKESLCILVVEDEPAIGLALVQLLEELGHRVCALEATPSGAVSAVRRCKPDLMLVDARLGEESGVAAVTDILRDAPIPYVLMSGGRIPEAMPGAVVLEKPFFEAGLVRAMQSALTSPVAA